MVRFGEGEYFAGRHVEKLSARVDEATHQPRTSDTVNFRTGASDPAADGFARYAKVGALLDAHRARFHPLPQTAFEVARVKRFVAQLFSASDADVQALHAVGNRRRCIC